MNYLNIYNRIIDRAQGRKLSCYTESHHIIPRCMGGIDDCSNIVELTPEEHFVAHQLLVKIYPKNRKLVHAACMMTVSTKDVTRGPNKLYGWLRRKLSLSAQLNTGSANSSFGRSWYHNPVTLESGKFLSTDIPKGWILGRVPEKVKDCLVCKCQTPRFTQKYCNNCRPKKKKTVFKSDKQKEYYTDEEKSDALIKCDNKIRHALFLLGLNDSGENYRMMKKLKVPVYPHATNVLKG